MVADEMRRSKDISIHAPREGCDDTELAKAGYNMISIHAPREGCDLPMFKGFYRSIISIHAPREGCDLNCFASMKSRNDFNPRTP